MKNASKNAPARKRTRLRLPGTAPTDAEGLDGPQQTTSQLEKPAVTQPGTKPTAKKTNSTRQKKRRGAKTTPAAPETGGDEMNVDPPPVADSSTPVVKKKAQQPPKQGTRASARLRGQNPTTTHEPTPTGLGVKQTKRKGGPSVKDTNEDAIAEVPKKQIEVADDQTDTPTRAENATTGDAPPADLAASEDVTVDHPEEPAKGHTDDEAEASTAEDEEEGTELVHRFYIRKQNGNFSICMGLFPRGSEPTTQYL